MTTSTDSEIHDLKAFVGILEHDQIERIDQLLERFHDRGYTHEALVEIATLGDAIRAIKDNIAFREKIDAP